MSSWSYWNAWTAGTTTASGNFIASLSRDFAAGDRLDAQLQVQVDGTWHTIDSKWTIIQPMRTGNITITAPIQGSRNFGGTLTNLEIGSTYRVIAKADFMSSWSYWNAWTAGTTTASGNFIAPLSRDFAPGDRLDAQLQVQVNGTWYTIDTAVVFVESPPQTNTPHGGSGMYYLRARWYDPTTARFITQDPIRDGMNWYIYCGNDPVNFIDPSGLTYRAVNEIATSIGGTATAVSDRRRGNGYTITMGDKSATYYEGDISSFWQNGTFYVDDITFLNHWGFTGDDRSTSLNYFLLNDAWFVGVTYEMAKGLTTITRGWSNDQRAHFLAQCSYESDYGRHLTENDYGDKVYLQRQRYYPYYGAGFIMLTGRDNYAAFAAHMGDPRILSEGPIYVANNYYWSSAAWWWGQADMNNKINNGYTSNNVSGVVTAWNRNAPDNGSYAERQRRYEHISWLLSR